MKKDGIKSWADLYVLLRESYESNKDERDKLFNEIFRCCKEDAEMAEKHLDISFTDRKEEEEYGLKGAILFEEEGHYYLRLHYKQENGDDLYIPKLSLPIDQIPNLKDQCRTHEGFFGRLKFEECYAIWGDIRLEAEKSVMTVPDDNGNPLKTPSPCHYILVRPKKKMTKKEIENALGYNIEIVVED